MAKSAEKEPRKRFRVTLSGVPALVANPWEGEADNETDAKIKHLEANGLVGSDHKFTIEEMLPEPAAG